MVYRKRIVILLLLIAALLANFWLGSRYPAIDEKAAMAGEARRNGRGKPSLADGLLAAIALRTGATVATRNVADFQAMACPCVNPLCVDPLRR